MNSNLKPPESLAKFSIVCFHYNPEKNKNRIVLQIPDEKFEESDTYYLRLDNARDTAYILHLKNGMEMLDCLKLHCHILYRSNGTFEVLEDKNAAFGRHNPFADVTGGDYKVSRRKSESPWKVSALWCRKQK
jgi:hypothetical protein